MCHERFPFDNSFKRKRDDKSTRRYQKYTSVRRVQFETLPRVRLKPVTTSISVMNILYPGRNLIQGNSRSVFWIFSKFESRE